jgi:uncharacterized protein YndB with AHSA1/START domain
MTLQIKPAPVRRQITVRATPERAFQVFAGDFGRWWPNTHKIGAAPLKAAVLEPRLGGRWYEIGEDGSECDWGEVLAWEPPERLLLAWRIGGDFRADPKLQTEVEVRFIAESAEVTRVELEHRHLERMGETAEQGRAAVSGEGGWSGLLKIYARAVES